jgi:hypothetical protein
MSGGSYRYEREAALQVLGAGRGRGHIGVMDDTKDKPATPTPAPVSKPITRKEDLPKVEEIGGPQGPEPTRFGDWSIKGRVSDF